MDPDALPKGIKNVSQAKVKYSINCIEKLHCTTTLLNRYCFNSIMNLAKSTILTAQAKTTCDLKQSCRFVGNNGMMGDPCYGVHKYTKIRFWCIDEQMLLQLGYTLADVKAMEMMELVALGKKLTDRKNDSAIESGECYEDNKKNRILPIHIGDYDNNQMSVCIAACDGYKYAGMQYSYQCFCGNILPEMSLKRPGECTTRCPGKAAESCGASWRMNIFDVTGKFRLEIKSY